MTFIPISVIFSAKARQSSTLLSAINSWRSRANDIMVAEFQVGNLLPGPVLDRAAETQRGETHGLQAQIT